MELRTHILHIDDDASMTLLTRKFLGDHGFEVDVLNDSTQWKEVFTAAHAVVILDIEMPHVSGIEILDELKRRHPDVGAIMLTGLVKVTSLMTSRRLGADYCYFKPLKKKELLLQSVEHLFAQQQHWMEAAVSLSKQRKKLQSA